jgi:protein gp37
LPEALANPLRDRDPKRYFVNSWSDLFHPKVPDEFIDWVFTVMEAA